MPNTEVKKKHKPKSVSKPVPIVYTHVVAGIIKDSIDPQKLLITRRKKGQHLEHLWEFPGGKVEPGESRFLALQRELHEELGIRVTAADPFQSIYHRYADKNIHLDVWEIKHFVGEAHGREGQEYEWVNIKDLSAYDFPEADEPLLKALQLPPRLLITPDMPEEHEATYVDQFSQLMERRLYPLVLFRSHHLDDQRYADVAQKLNTICQKEKSELIIHRPSLKSLQANYFETYQRRHLSSYILQSLQTQPFDESIKISASCHDVAELKMAERLDCHFALMSTIRDTQSHPGRRAKGWLGLKNMIDRTHLPVYALGGVKRKDVCIARFQGSVGVAGITDFWSVD